MEIELVNYIKEAREHGLPDQQIKKNLLDAGWEAVAVEESFAHVKAIAGQPLAQHLSAVLPETQPMNRAQAAVSVSGPIISDAQITQKRKFSRKAIFLAIVILFACAGGAFGYYTFVLNSPEKIWKKFIAATKNSIVQNNFTFSYSDPGLKVPPKGASLFNIPSLKFIILGNIYSKITDPKNAESKADTQYTFSAGNTSFSTGFQYMLKNNALYLNIGDNPLFSGFSQQLSPDKRIQWLKLDLGLLQSMQDSSSKQQVAQLEEIFNPAFTKELQKVWDDATIIKLKKYVGREKLNGVSTIHFENELDKKALQDTLDILLDKVAAKLNAAGGNKLTDQQVADGKYAIAEIISRIEIKRLETWIGISDARLYRIQFASNAPSFLSAIQAGQDSIQSLGVLDKSRDAKRLADMRQMASALELYYNDNGGYPDGTADGQPSGSITPNYIGQIPKAPAPASGICTDYYNTYWYTPKGNKKSMNGKTVYNSYEYTFCLGSSTGGYAPGIAKLSPNGITANVACTDKPENCPQQANAPASQNNQDKIKAFLDQVDFSGEITMSSEFSNYGKKLDITPPTESIDILQVLAPTREGIRPASMR